jgi:hypothetical protein
LLIGHDFGITKDIETGPNGDVFVCRIRHGAVYEISGKQPALFTANLTARRKTPPKIQLQVGTAKRFF